MSPPRKLLLLGGSGEALFLAPKLGAQGWHVTLSRLRPVIETDMAGVELRQGGFGGALGLAAYLREQGIKLLVDATHPFSATMSRNAYEAARAADVPRLCLLRPPWRGHDHWAESLEEAADKLKALGAETMPLLAVGARGGKAFLDSERPLVLGALTRPDVPLPRSWRFRPMDVETDVERERAFLKEAGITHLICRNSGGERAYIKCRAALSLGIPLLLIKRPAPPPPPLVSSVAEALRRTAARAEEMDMGGVIERAL